jgi:hypothetical protein
MPLLAMARGAPKMNAGSDGGIVQLMIQVFDQSRNSVDNKSAVSPLPTELALIEATVTRASSFLARGSRSGGQAFGVGDRGIAWNQIRQSIFPSTIHRTTDHKIRMPDQSTPRDCPHPGCFQVTVFE